ncbi:MAG: hypothetical protein HY796_01725 [Elusimicrobia bacterium]|nr:hypothetical protein [Elusimicrobiota bacterium]
MNRLLNKALKRRPGQNTVEYLLMLAVVVGVVLIAGMAIKQYMPTLWGQIQAKIGGAADSLTASEGGK